ncbi:Vacuolar protein sorting-associated protein ist1 [Recurvomyces mirabilis]|nr:Vacuolar protein sorting-associated protein ist1 [Recurvomyces mirabilis]
MPPASTLVNKIKVQLKLSVSRLRMVQQKDTALAKQQRRAMAQLLEQGKEESARIRVENIIRSDMNTELLEILELYCELLTARAGLLEQKECDPGLEEAVKSIIFAAPKVEGVKELGTVRALLVEKYGKEFVLEAVENRDGKVAARVADRLKVEPPRRELVDAYLETIAEAYGVDWPVGTAAAARKRAEEEAEAEGEEDDDDDEPSGGQKVRALEAPLEAEELSKATPPRDLVGPKSPVTVVPPSPSTDNVRPRVNLPGPPDLKPGKKMVDAGKAKAAAAAGVNGDKKADGGGGSGGPGGKIPDVDELAKRFAQLKR